MSDHNVIMFTNIKNQFGNAYLINKEQFSSCSSQSHANSKDDITKKLREHIYSYMQNRPVTN